MAQLKKLAKGYLILIILVCSSTIGNGQEISSIDSIPANQTMLRIHSPHKATIYSALVPGLGQVYNKKYWKLPIIYGLTGIFIYAFDFNNDNYNKYKNAYADMLSGKIVTFQGYTQYQVEFLKDGYRRNRDLNVIALAAIYLLNIVDATVDAHLFNYDISDELSLNIQPVVNKTFNNQSSVVLSCNFSF